tara:strand:+ start:318 stop:680 length:363 start_codon:yes stop_codon:yes gene_type:complete
MRKQLLFLIICCISTLSMNVSAQCSNDITPPTIICNNTGTLTKIISNLKSAYIVDSKILIPTATDNCCAPKLSFKLSGATKATGTNLMGYSFNTAITSVLWTATDKNGNKNYSTFKIQVI